MVIPSFAPVFCCASNLKGEEKEKGKEEFDPKQFL